MPAPRATRPAVMAGRVGAPMAASRLMAVRVGSYPAAPAPSVAHAATNATGPATPPAAAARRRALPSDQAGQRPDGGDQPDADHHRTAPDRRPGQLVVL